jgi:hypothetical protein
MPCRAVREFVGAQRLQARHLTDQLYVPVRQDYINERKTIIVKSPSQRNVRTYTRLTSSGGTGYTSHIFPPCQSLVVCVYKCRGMDLLEGSQSPFSLKREPPCSGASL